MSDYTVALADVRRVTGLGDFAARGILAKPKPLPYVKAKTGPRGGNSQRLYSLRQIILRLRQKHWFTPQMEHELCRIDLTARTKEVVSE